MEAIAPVLDPISAWLQRLWARAQIAYYRRALAERVGPTHPDRTRIELRVQLLERSL